MADYSLVNGPSVNPWQLQMPGAADLNWGGMGGGGVGQTPGFGFNLPTFGTALQGLASIGGVWNAFNSNKLAKEQLDFQKSFGETNLANSIQSYNTQLSDRARSRGVAEGQSAQQVNDYVAANSLSRK